VKKNEDVINPFRVREKDPKLICSTHRLVPRRRDINRKDVEAYVESVKSYNKEKKLKKVDDIEVIEEK
jgi:hypothetical protein